MTIDRKKIWNEAVKFHGHSCPGLAIGARIAMDYMEKNIMHVRAEDEEVVAVIETDACGVDAIQVILGCTAGKGNLWLQKRGKHVFTFFQRNSGKGLRYSWKGFNADEKNREEKIAYFLNGAKDELYNIEEARFPLPPEASIYGSIYCADCGEHTAEPCLRVKDGQMICLDCAGDKFNFSQRIIL